MELEEAASQESAPGTENPQAVGTESAPVATAAETTAQPGSEPTAAEPQEPGKEHQKLRQRAQRAETEAAYWRGIAEGRGSQPVAPPVVAAPPKQEDFEDYDEFIRATARWEVAQESRAHAERETARAREASWNARLQAAAAEDPEILDVVNDRTLPVSPAMAEAIKESEVGPKVLRYLADHPDEATKIARMGGFAAAKEIGRIEHAITTAKPEVKKVSTAPTPISTVGGNAGGEVVDEDKLSVNDWMARENARDHERRFGRRA